MKNLNLKQANGSRNKYPNRENSCPRKTKILNEKSIKMIYESCFIFESKTKSNIANHKNIIDIFTLLSDPKSKALIVIF
jgi:hypothetical protein